MRHRSRTLLGCFFASLLMGGAVHAEGGTSPGYKNVKLSAEERAADLVHRMTLEEKASQLVNQ